MSATHPLRTVTQRISTALQQAARRSLGDELPDLVLGEPPDPTKGDFAVSACLPAARIFRKSPKAIAEAVVGALEPIEGVARVEIAGPGYLNVFLDRPRMLRDLLAWHEAAPAPPSDVFDAPPLPGGDAPPLPGGDAPPLPGGDAPPLPGGDAPLRTGGDAQPRTRGKVVVEHTNINPNKAAHVGHLRNAILGDCLCRLLQHQGHDVEVQNYIDDTGVQVADVVVALTAMEDHAPDEALARVEEAARDDAPVPFDHLCWDLYAAVGRWFEEDESRLEHRREALHAMESGEGPLARLADEVATRIVHCHLALMERLGIRYHLLPWESDILAAHFWSTAFERLKAADAIRLEEDGKNVGCWVMPLAETEEFKDLEEPDKVLVRSNGTVTYTGKDIAFQMWKLGLIGADFRYRPFLDYEDGKRLWSSDQDARDTTGDEDHPPFGGAERVYNVIDVRQSYPQAVVRNALLLAGHEREAAASHHFSYEMVALSPGTAEALGFELTDEQRSAAHVEMSGRKGLGVKASDLIDALTAEARGRVAATNDERGLGLSSEDIDATAAAVAVGALRYYMAKVTKNRLIAFDIDEALQFQGEAGPYLQYTAVRTANIFRKLAAEGGPLEGELAEAAAGEAMGIAADEATWQVVMSAARIPAVVDRATEALEISTLAKHAFVLCQAFNGFYRDNSILHAETESLKRERACVARLFLLALRQVLGLLGVPEPERM